jgi:hypothetical protein
MQTSGGPRREIAKLYPRHCERSEAIHLSACRAMDCVAALAMTWRELASLHPLAREARGAAVSKGEATLRDHLSGPRALVTARPASIYGGHISL